MATKKFNQKPAPAPPGGQSQTGGSSPNDAKLLKYVWGNAQRIVASISFAASRAGEQQRWSEVNDYLAIANQLSP